MIRLFKDGPKLLSHSPVTLKTCQEVWTHSLSQLSSLVDQFIDQIKAQIKVMMDVFKSAGQDAATEQAAAVASLNRQQNN